MWHLWYRDMALHLYVTIFTKFLRYFYSSDHKVFNSVRFSQPQTWLFIDLLPGKFCWKRNRTNGTLAMMKIKLQKNLAKRTRVLKNKSCLALFNSWKSKVSRVLKRKNKFAKYIIFFIKLFNARNHKIIFSPVSDKSLKKKIG